MSAFRASSLQPWHLAWDTEEVDSAAQVSCSCCTLHAGNHERDWPGTGTRFDFPPAKDSGGECGVPYDKRFPMPLPGPDKEWYVPVCLDVTCTVCHLS